MTGKIDYLLFRLFWVLEHFMGKRLTETLLGGPRARLEARIYRDTLALPPQSGDRNRFAQVERRRDLSADEFRLRYLNTRTPVILEGFANQWSAIGKWSTDFFSTQYGTDDLVISDPSDTQEEQKLKVSSLREIIRDMAQGGKSYARVSPLLHRHPELLKDLDIPSLLRLLNLKKELPHTHYHFFLGPGRAHSKTHAEPTHNFFAQIHGQKRWLILPPKYSGIMRPRVERAPYFMSDIALKFEAQDPVVNSVALEAVLNPGDILFNPAFNWHYVENPVDSIGVGFRWADMGAMIKSSPLMTFLYLCSTNPPLLYSVIHSDDTTKTFSYRKKVVPRTGTSLS